MTALNLEMSEVFTPVIPAMIGGAIFVLFMAFTLGRQEKSGLVL